jgi:hypothetical protein
MWDRQRSIVVDNFRGRVSFHLVCGFPRPEVNDSFHKVSMYALRCHDYRSDPTLAPDLDIERSFGSIIDYQASSDDTASEIILVIQFRSCRKPMVLIL